MSYLYGYHDREAMCFFADTIRSCYYFYLIIPYIGCAVYRWCINDFFYSISVMTIGFL